MAQRGVEAGVTGPMLSTFSPETDEELLPCVPLCLSPPLGTCFLSCRLSGGHTDYVRGLAWDGSSTLYTGGWDMKVLAWTGFQWQ